MTPIRILVACIATGVVAFLVVVHHQRHSIDTPYNIICNKAGQFGYVDVYGEKITSRREYRVVPIGTNGHDWIEQPIDIYFTNREQAVGERDTYRSFKQREQQRRIATEFKVCP